MMWYFDYRLFQSMNFLSCFGTQPPGDPHKHTLIMTMQPYYCILLLPSCLAHVITSTTIRPTGCHRINTDFNLVKAAMPIVCALPPCNPNRTVYVICLVLAAHLLVQEMQERNEGFRAITPQSWRLIHARESMMQCK